MNIEKCSSGYTGPLGRRGGILVMTALAAVFMISMIAMVTDVGYMYYSHSRLQTAVNAGWKAGFDRLSGYELGKELTPSEQESIKAHIREVIRSNGFSQEQLSDEDIDIDVKRNSLRVVAKGKIGLFFARIMNINSTEVGAIRDNESSFAGIIPLAIPHGTTKDFSKKMYSCSLFGADSGFRDGQEYILKLGSGAGNTEVPPEQDDLKMILIPMDSGAQKSETGYLRAYGIAFWCLRIGNGTDTGFTPVYWLLGYRGGSFFLPYHDDLIAKLKTNAYKSVSYEVIEGSDAIQAIFNQVNPNVLELYDRPRIAVYSSQAGADPVEEVLRSALIPYGEYSMPDGWQRAEDYDEDENSHIYDGEILSNALDGFHWVHLHHEDFTGFSGGCGRRNWTCRDFFDSNSLGTGANAQNRMCPYCSGKYTLVSKKWQWSNSYNVESCQLRNIRCAERQGKNGVFYRNDAGVTMCGSSDYLQCREYNTLRGIAAAHGFTSDAESEPKPRDYVDTGNNGPGIDADADGWFNKATAVQKMKWDVARKIRNHVEIGGFLFAQCFAPETLDIALWQAEIYDGKDSLTAFSGCFAFDDYSYRRFPIKNGVSYYSTINSPIAVGTSLPFNLIGAVEPRCQNHGTYPDTGTGHTAVFNHDCVKEETTILGSRTTNSSQARYVKGQKGAGEFTFLAGHYHHNVQSKRLVLNNILLGSLVEKDVTGDVPPPPEIAGKNKNNYGPIDVDNTTGGGANDYRDRFMHGFNNPIDINDRLLPEPGNMRGPTDQAVDFRVYGDALNRPNARIIVPITDIGPEIPLNSTKNEDAASIYDLQGTDHPNGIYRPENYDFEASVRIIGFAEFEVIPPASYTRAGYDGSLDYEAGDAGDLGPYQPGQVRGKFIRYIVNPNDLPDGKLY